MKKIKAGTKELLSLKVTSNSSSSYKKTFTGNKNIDIEILSNLSYEDLLNTCQINKYANELCKNNMLWRNKLAKDFPLRSKYLYNTEYIQYYQKDPRKLYEIIRKPSKIVTLKKEDYKSLSEAMPDDDSIVNIPGEEEYEMKDLTRSIKANHKIFYSLPLLRGDVIHFDWMNNYRNEGKVLWDGKQTHTLCYEFDDYGSIPRSFTFPEFSLDHFHNSINHNYIIWLSKENIEESIRNFDEKSQTTSISDSYNSYTINVGNEDDIFENHTYTKGEFTEIIKETSIVEYDIGVRSYVISWHSSFYTQ